jgi:hypothetical protein
VERAALAVLKLYIIGKHLERCSNNPVPVEVEIGKRFLV